MPFAYIRRFYDTPFGCNTACSYSPLSQQPSDTSLLHKTCITKVFIHSNGKRSHQVQFINYKTHPS